MSKCKKGGMLTVQQAAIRIGERVITRPRPVRHWHLFDLALELPIEDPIGQIEQGFLLSDGTFATRYEAEKVALASGQVTKLRGSILTTEDLW